MATIRKRNGRWNVEIRKKGLRAIYHYVARKIVWAINNKKSQIYIPFYWRIIIFLINLIPESLFKKINI